MVQIDKNDLRYLYNWNDIEGNHPKVTGILDSTMFNRREGYEVIYLINKLAEIWEFEEKSLCLKVEKMINILSSELRSQEAIKKWIEDNWERY